MNILKLSPRQLTKIIMAADQDIADLENKQSAEKSRLRKNVFASRIKNRKAIAGRCNDLLNK